MKKLITFRWGIRYGTAFGFLTGVGVTELLINNYNNLTNQKIHFIVIIALFLAVILGELIGFLAAKLDLFVNEKLVKSLSEENKH